MCIRDRALGPHSHSSASACLNDRVREAAKCLQAAFDGGDPMAKLHLAHLAFGSGQEDVALTHLKEHLSWRVQRGRDTCAGCEQTRVEDTPMLTCSGCRVARFCSADHQKMASKKASLGGSLRLLRIYPQMAAQGYLGLRGTREVARGCSRTVWRLTRVLQNFWRSCSEKNAHH